jgi:hypothetical protein
MHQVSHNVSTVRPGQRSNVILNNVSESLLDSTRFPLVHRVNSWKLVSFYFGILSWLENVRDHGIEREGQTAIVGIAVSCLEIISLLLKLGRKIIAIAANQTVQARHVQNVGPVILIQVSTYPTVSIFVRFNQNSTHVNRL